MSIRLKIDIRVSLLCLTQGIQEVEPRTVEIETAGFQSLTDICHAITLI